MRSYTGMSRDHMVGLLNRKSDTILRNNNLLKLLKGRLMIREAQLVRVHKMLGALIDHPHSVNGSGL